MPELIGERFPQDEQWRKEHFFFWLLRADVDAATYHMALNANIRKQQGEIFLDFDRESYEGFHVLTAVWR